MISRIGSFPDKGLAVARRLRDRFQLRSYFAGGQLPWTPGYHLHKRAVIEGATRDPAWNVERLPARYGWRLDERVVEYPWLFGRLSVGPGIVLDAGSILNHEYLVNHPKLDDKKLTIFTLAPEDQAYWPRGISYVFGDLRKTFFADEAFDVVVCLSTLEHVGFDNTMLYTSNTAKKENDPEACLEVIAELRRVLKPGGVLFLSVPFGLAVDHGWFQVYDGPGVDRLIATFGPSSVREIVYQYRPDGWTLSDRKSATDVLFFDIHKQRTYDPDYAAASRAVVCLELMK